MTVGVLVPAAGQGERLGDAPPAEQPAHGARPPKALRLLAGEPLLVHAVRGLRLAPSVEVIVVAAPREWAAEVAAMLTSFDIVVVPGGEQRQESVALALTALPPEVDLVLVHDAARCLTPPDVVERVVAALRAGAEAVVPVVPLADTVKRVADGRVAETLDRSALRAAQTPQGFRRDLLTAAHRSGSGSVTDDAGMVEALGHTVTLVTGSDEAFKVTGPQDLLLAEAVLRARG
ncbi:MAG: 2-C-methyl-D-erythritol 4-phosphate cytidylyltransferase [Actinomycetota bacterium]|nr:2-C-methyl-D-erythritol 4-phosphate cytidylyltransferase [Actinomycetota bacterium]